MISYQNIKTVALYEKKTLTRSWFFKIFALIALIGITLFHILTTLDIIQIPTWIFKAIPGNIPYSNLKYLNIIQSIIAVFLASGFLKRDKKFDTSVVIHVRPMSNAEYIFGKTLGIFKVFMGLNIISLLIAFIINSIGANTPLDITTYIIYPLLISIPSLIFILGLSFILMIIIKNQSITFLILLGYVGLCVFYFGERYDGILDYTSYNLPILHSDIIGFADFSRIILHRGAYFLLGLGFICLSIKKVNRLPHSTLKVKRYFALAIIFIISGLSFIGFIAKENNDNHNRRLIYKDLDHDFFNKPTVDITDIDIQLTHKGNNIACEARLIVKNNNKKAIDSYILSLNPGLKINNFLCNDKKVKLERKEHIIIVTPDSPIKMGEEKSLQISYSGSIDETICYNDINDNNYKEPFNVLNFNIEKKYAFITNKFVLLTPESLWYPIAGIKYNSEKPVFGNYNFSKYSLKVKTDKNLTAISQGEYSNNNNGEFIFRPETPLTQISLAIGDFEQKQIIVDSLDIRLLYYKGHDYFSSVFKDINDTIPSLVKEFKDQYELEKKRNYPFKRLSLIEVPAQFKTFPRLWTTHRETVQPEMVFLPESGLTLPDADFVSSFKNMKKWRQRGNGNMDEKKIKISLFVRTLHQIFKTSGGYTSSMNRQLRKNANINMGRDLFSFYEYIYSLNPNFYTYINNICSKDYPIVNTLFESILNNGNSSMRNMFRYMMGGLNSQEASNIYLKNRSFSDILSSKKINSTKLPAIIENKANYLKAILTNKINKEEFNKYMSDYLERHKYTNTSFETMLNDFCDNFNLKIKKDINNWYNSRKTPGYIISEIIGTQIIDKDSKKYQLEFNITNNEPQAGIITVNIIGGNMRFGRRRRSKQNSPNETNLSYYIEGNTSYKIGVVCSQKPMMVNINTLTSQNIPASLTSRFEKFEESKKQPFHGIMKVTDIDSFNNEIIVDNEDPGFSLEENIKEVKLKKLFKKEEDIAPDEKYKGTIFWNPPIKWTLTAKGDYYGKYIRSAYYIKGGDGKQKAIWKANIKKAGYYDVYFYKQNDKRIQFGFGRKSHKMNLPKFNYNISVYSDDGENHIELNTLENNGNWLYLGSYYFSPGETKVVLTNKSDASVIFADAVKWVKKKQ